MTEVEKEAMRNARNAYRREWSRRNPDKVKAAQEKYWLRRAEREAAEQKEAEADAETQRI